MSRRVTRSGRTFSLLDTKPSPKPSGSKRSISPDPSSSKRSTISDPSSSKRSTSPEPSSSKRSISSVPTNSHQRPGPLCSKRPQKIQIETTKEQLRIRIGNEDELLFDRRYSRSFYDFRNDYLINPFSTVKLTTVQLRAYIREQADWEQNLWNEQVIQKWVQDFKDVNPVEYDDYKPASPVVPFRKKPKIKKNQSRTLVSESERSAFSSYNVDRIIDELEHLAKFKDRPIQFGPVKGTWQSDSLIKPDLREELIQNVSILEASISNKDWNDPNQIVWNLVHPSMYCLVKGKSRILKVPYRVNTNETNRADLLKLHAAEDFLSLEEGNYIGFDHRIYRNERGDDYEASKKYQWLPSEFRIGKDNSVQIASYINNLHPGDHSGLYSVIEKIFQKFIPMFSKVQFLRHRLLRRRMGQQPPAFSEAIEKAYKTQEIELAGKTIQVITKLTNYELTPEKPEYPGGQFHSEGMSNEQIIASGLYYYDSENITESRLELQQATYDQKNQMQRYGSFLTKEGRCIVFSNKMEHRVTPFRLVDPTRNGYRKILAFFLIDPEVPIVSTAHVPPQQKDWFVKEVMKGSVCVPEEIVDMIVSNLEDNRMDSKEAIQHRDELKSERKRVFENLDGSSTGRRGCRKRKPMLMD